MRTSAQTGHPAPFLLPWPGELRRWTRSGLISALCGLLILAGCGDRAGEPELETQTAMAPLQNAQGDGAPADTQEEPEGSGIEVTWDLDVVVRGNTVYVNGETSLPDGAVLYVEIIGTGEPVGVDDFSYAETTVFQSSFSETFPVGDWTAENVEVLVAFSNLNVTQPADVQARMGGAGKGIRGPLATSRGHLGIFPDHRWAEEVVTVPRR